MQAVDFRAGQSFGEEQGFSATILKINSRISLITGFLPTGLRTLEVSRQ